MQLGKLKYLATKQLDSLLMVGVCKVVSLLYFYKLGPYPESN